MKQRISWVYQGWQNYKRHPFGDYFGPSVDFEDIFQQKHWSLIEKELQFWTWHFIVVVHDFHHHQHYWTMILEQVNINLWIWKWRKWSKSLIQCSEWIIHRYTRSFKPHTMSLIHILDGARETRTKTMSSMIQNEQRTTTQQHHNSSSRWKVIMRHVFSLLAIVLDCGVFWLSIWWWCWDKLWWNSFVFWVIYFSLSLVEAWKNGCTS